MKEWKTGNPDKKGRYIATIHPAGYDASVLEMDWTGKRWYHPNKPDLVSYNVTAWMPMPEPYLQTEE